MRKGPARTLALAAALSACLVLPSPGRAKEVTLWQIGNFDQSSEEFGSSFGIAPSSAGQPDPVYRVGRGDWKKDWPGFQPGSANGLTGGREHPFTVVFSLDQRPRGRYTLTVATLPYMPRRPDLRLEINGKRGTFYLRPHISYDLGNFPAAFIPQYSFHQLEIELPAEYFKQGENRLVLTVTGVDDVHVGIEAMKRGAGDYLTKPFQLEAVIASIQRAAGGPQSFTCWPTI